MAAQNIRHIHDMGRHTPVHTLMWRFVAAMLSGVAGALGIGGGGILIIYLAMIASIGQLEAQGINLLFFLPCGAVALIIHAIKKRIDYKSAFLLMLGGVPGAVLGFIIAGYIGSGWLGKLFAVLLIIMGAKSLLFKEKA